MNCKKPLQITLLAICMAVSALVSAEPRYEQKLILVQGTESRFMDGEHKPLFDFNKNKVLPYLLARGWRIASVNTNEKFKEGGMNGYVVVEREIPSNE